MTKVSPPNGGLALYQIEVQQSGFDLERRSDGVSERSVFGIKTSSRTIRSPRRRRSEWRDSNSRPPRSAPPCGKQKMHRPMDGARIFRPLRQQRLCFFCPRQRKAAVPKSGCACFGGGRKHSLDPQMIKGSPPNGALPFMVRVARLELAASCSQSRHPTNWATPGDMSHVSAARPGQTQAKGIIANPPEIRKGSAPAKEKNGTGR